MQLNRQPTERAPRDGLARPPRGAALAAITTLTRFSARVLPLALTLTLLAACGGSDGADGRSGPALNLSEQERTERALRLAAQIQAPAVANAREKAGLASISPDELSGSDDATGPQRCLHRLALVLATRGAGEWPVRAQAECLAGSYKGLTPEGEACALRVERLSGLFRFRLDGQTLGVEPDSRASLLGDSFRAKALSTSPVDSAIEIARNFLPEGATAPARDTLRLRGGHKAKGPKDLFRVDFERVEAGAGSLPQRLSCIFAA